MPSVNVYTEDDAVIQQLKELLVPLQAFVAKRLSCGELELQPREVSVRVIKPVASLMIYPLEIEMSAYAFAERVEQEDIICREVVAFLKESEPRLPDMHVWLTLSELGHSWEE